MTAARLRLLEEHQEALRRCTLCPKMHRPVVLGAAVLSPVLLVGQAPGDKEPRLGRPFAWTAGKNLFKWFARLGVDEERFRARAYMAAVCRCFPGKNPSGGDRVPDADEIERCAPHLAREVELCRPALIIPVGKLAIARFLGELAGRPLSEVIGRGYPWTQGRHRAEVIPLPHPSGASTWYHRDPGRALTEAALALIGAHPAWQRLRD